MIKQITLFSSLIIAACLVFATAQTTQQKKNPNRETSMNYSIVSKPAFDVVGIQIKTDNSRGAAGFAPLWQRFYAENIQQQIPHKIDDGVIAVYSEYEGDHTKSFSFFIGCRVSKVDTLPGPLIVKHIPAAEYALFVAKGEMPQAVGTTWIEGIWKSDLKRAWKADFEVYGARFFAREGNDKEVDIFIGI